MLIIQDATLQQLKSQISENIIQYESNEIWCEEILEIDKENIVPSIKLVFGEGKKSDYDLEHAIVLHKALRNIPLSIATKENYWAFLTHTVFWEYMRERWPIEDAQKSKTNYIMNRYFFGPATIYRNGLARLWWYAQFTYDATLENPYFYTEIILRTQDLAGTVAQSANITRNRKVLQASLLVVNRLLDLEESEIIPKIKKREDFIRSIFIHANYIATVVVLEFLDLDELEEKLWEYVSVQLEINEQLSLKGLGI